MSLLNKWGVFLDCYGDSRHPTKARQGFWRMQAWLVILISLLKIHHAAQFITSEKSSGIFIDAVEYSLSIPVGVQCVVRGDNDAVIAPQRTVCRERLCFEDI